ncbi:MAG: SlyX family protein [Thiotrichales bacterium]|nr:SlyX family protein [Thiotrichales bacterium]
MTDLTVNELKEQMSNIEITQAFQDDTIESLQKTVAIQHQEIQMLQKQMTLLSDYIKNMKEGGNIRLPSEEVPPPHY